MPVDDEQRVVDADGEPEHQGERRGHRVEVGERREGDGPGQSHADAEQGDEERKPGGDQAAQRDDEHDEGDGQAEHLTGTDERGVLGDLDAVVGGEARGGQGGVRAGGDEGTVVDRDGLGVVVELHLDDRVRAVLGDQTRRGGGAADGLAVLVLGPARGQLRLALGQVGLGGVDLRAAGLDLLAQAGDGRVLRVGGLELVEHGLAGVQLPLGLEQLGAPRLELGLALLERAGGGGEVGGALVETRLRLERVVDPLDVRHLGPGGEHLLGGRALLVGDGRAVGALQHHRAGATGGLGDLLTEPVDDLLEGRAGDGDLAGQRLADGAGEDTETDQDDEPDGQRAPRVGGTPAAEAVQEGGHGAFSRCGRVRRCARRRWRAWGPGRFGRAR